MEERIRFTRVLRRRIFPFVVILLTILAVAYFLEKRDAPQETLVLPN